MQTLFSIKKKKKQSTIHQHLKQDLIDCGSNLTHNFQKARFKLMILQDASSFYTLQAMNPFIFMKRKVKFFLGLKPS